MKRLVSLLLLISVLLVGCGKEDPEVPTEVSEVPVATEPTTKTVYVHSSITRTQGTTTRRTDYIYNDENLLTDVIMSDGEGTELQRYLVTCDDNGNPIEWASAWNDMVTYTYDSQGRILRTDTYMGENLTTSTQYIWSGDLQISVITGSDGHEERTEYTYDEKGGLTRRDSYVSGTLTGFGLYTLDEEGKIILVQSFDPEGNPLSETTYEYEGNTEKWTIKDLQGNVMQAKQMTYDDYGNLLQGDLLDSSGGIIFSEVHEWLPVEVSLDSIRASV